jgi:RimJ/RimL family protein N-acetyltransferase
MQLADFIATHVPALEKDEVRHNLILGVLGRAQRGLLPQLATWSLGAPGECAIARPGWPMLLGELARAQCRALAEATHGLDYPGVVGPGPMPKWFVERAVERGLAFCDPIPQRIHVLRQAPNYPGSSGFARQVSSEDAVLLADWMTAFSAEAVPHETVGARRELERIAGEGRHWLWVVDGEPVAMAGIARRLRSVAAISSVYTPPDRRGRGYAGSVTAAVADRVFAEGRTAVCLFTDLRNPASNRCYAKIGFEPVCDSWHYVRLARM